MIKKICVVTGGRADYGLLRLLMQEIRKNRQFQLQVIATGSHFLPKFGSTYHEILKDGFEINARVEMSPVGDSAVALGEVMGLGVKGISKALAILRPDLILLLGDRYEILAAAAAATLASVPIAHLHGGELTEGAYDDAFRHAITKMAYLHFVSNPTYRRRVIQMGESPSRVFQVGALGVDNVLSQKFLPRQRLEKVLGFRLQNTNLLITFHPATMEIRQAGRQTDALLKALRYFPETGMIFTMPGADRESNLVWKKIRAFARRHPHSKCFRAMGSRIYLSVMKEVNAVVGNSSSGILEAPALNKPSINIGDRQRGRIQAASVINCADQSGSIRKSIRRVLSQRTQFPRRRYKNPYGAGGAALKIVKILRKWRSKKFTPKTFWDDSR